MATSPPAVPTELRIKNMRKLLLAVSACVLVLSIAPGISAQQRRLSPHETTSIKINGHKITIDYGRPYLRGRKMLGVHEPYGKVWRTGADEATTLKTDTDIEIAGLKVPKGKYSLFTVPGENQWKLIVNKVANQWGAFNYNEAQDLGRVDMTVTKSEKPLEQFTIKFLPTGPDSATLELAWENTVATVPVKVL